MKICTGMCSTQICFFNNYILLDGYFWIDLSMCRVNIKDSRSSCRPLNIPTFSFITYNIIGKDGKLRFEKTKKHLTPSQQGLNKITPKLKVSFPTDKLPIPISIKYQLPN